MNEDDVNWGTTNLNEAMIVAVVIAITRYFQGWFITNNISFCYIFI